MCSQFTLPINTRLQPGVECGSAAEPFQRLAGGGETVETVFSFPASITGLKPGVNENDSNIYDNSIRL
jgi:hypothetical protein